MVRGVQERVLRDLPWGVVLVASLVLEVPPSLGANCFLLFGALGLDPFPLEVVLVFLKFI